MASDQPTMVKLFSALVRRMVQHIGASCGKSYAKKLPCCKTPPDGPEPLNTTPVIHTSNPIIETDEYLAFQMIVNFLPVACTGTIYLDVLPPDTVDEIRSNGYPEEGILFDNHFSPVFKGKALQNGITLSEHLLGQGSKLYLVVRADRAIFVKPLHGKTILLIFDYSEFFDNAKKLPFDQQQLNFAGKDLEAGRTLEQYNIRHCCILHLLLHLCGDGQILHIQTPNGKVVSLIPHPSATIYDLKSEICDIEGIPPREQILMLSEKELENCGTCADIGDSNTLHLLFGNLSLGISGLVSADPRKIWAPSTLERDIDYQQRHLPKIWRPVVPKLINQSPSEALPVSEPDIVESPVAESTMTTPQSYRLTNGPTMGTPHSGFSSSPPSVTPKVITCEVPECNIEFQTRAEYTRHMRYHTRREKCPHCNRGFGTITHLNRHINDVHQRANIYYCPVTDCKYWRMSGKGNFFSRKGNLKRHLRDTHGRIDEI